MKFDWDSNKDRANQKKHGVAFSTAKKSFKTAMSLLFQTKNIV